MLQQGAFQWPSQLSLNFLVRDGPTMKKCPTDFKEAKKQARRLAGKGCARAYSRTDAWRLASNRCLAIASRLHTFRQDAQASIAKGRTSKGENEDLSPYQIHQILKLKLTQILGLTHVCFRG
jgi:hypothetical protein